MVQIDRRAILKEKLRDARHLQASLHKKPDIFLIFVCAFIVILLSTLPLVIAKLKSHNGPEIVAAKLPELNTRLLEPHSKDLFFAKLSSRQRKYFLALVHYVTDIIRKARGDSSGAYDLAYTIVSESLAANYDPLFVSSLILAESSFRKHVRSSMGALGLMQLKPSTARYVSRLYGVKWQGPESLKDPQYNLQLGIAYLKYLEGLFDGNMTHALVAYNWGPGNVSGVLSGKINRMPRSCLAYSRQILKNHQSWRTDLIAQDMRKHFGVTVVGRG